MLNSGKYLFKYLKLSWISFHNKKRLSSLDIPLSSIFRPMPRLNFPAGQK
uniref:Lysozyme n=1 Tax=uncultured marine virus TaxID=186617 RepID=A0A0F7L657_9VIRU|nr:lysozyme [uncultured marine virus]